MRQQIYIDRNGGVPVTLHGTMFEIGGAFFDFDYANPTFPNGYEWTTSAGYVDNPPSEFSLDIVGWADNAAIIASGTILHFRALCQCHPSGDWVYGQDKTWVVIRGPISPPADNTIVKPKVSLEAIRNIEMSTMGRIYVDEQGNFTYESRYARNP